MKALHRVWADPIIPKSNVMKGFVEVLAQVVVIYTMLVHSTHDDHYKHIKNLDVYVF
jgi:hypothetical protein